MLPSLLCYLCARDSISFSIFSCSSTFQVLSSFLCINHDCLHIFIIGYFYLFVIGNVLCVLFIFRLINNYNFYLIANKQNLIQMCHKRNFVIFISLKTCFLLIIIILSRIFQHSSMHAKYFWLESDCTLLDKYLFILRHRKNTNKFNTNFYFSSMKLFLLS